MERARNRIWQPWQLCRARRQITHVTSYFWKRKVCLSVRIFYRDCNAMWLSWLCVKVLKRGLKNAFEKILFAKLEDGNVIGGYG